jgi:hypothetical protein
VDAVEFCQLHRNRLGKLGLGPIAEALRAQAKTEVPAVAV